MRRYDGSACRCAAGMTVLPSASTGSASVAEKDCPAWLSLELSVSPRRTVRTVPAGITIGAGAAAASLPEAIAPPLPLPFAELVAELLSAVAAPPLAAGLFGLFESVVVAELASFAGGLEVQATTAKVR